MLKPTLVVIFISLSGIILAQEALTPLAPLEKKELKRMEVPRQRMREIVKRDMPEVKPVSEEQIINRAIEDLLSSNITKQRNAERKLVTYGKKAVPYMIKAFARPQLELHIILTRLSVEIGVTAEDEFLAALNDERGDIRWHAAKVLGSIGSKRAVRPLISALDDPIMRPTAVDALGMLGDKDAIPYLQNMLDTNDDFLRMLLTQALKRLGVKIQLSSPEE